MTHSLVVHAHCYQPPREDPWFELVEAEPSAVPDHDWNARIDRECYARLGAAVVRAPDPAAAARDPDARGGIARMVNLYAWCSFDVGATLCEWMDGASDTLRAMQAGDAASVARWGHGNAIAAPYHHVILPLASRRDKITEVRWGIADFTRRFGRIPDGMWLPECAVDEETLEVLALHDIRFTILAPYQVQTREAHRGMPVRWNAGAGRSIAILPYDGALAGDVAFGSLLRDPAALARRFMTGLDDAAPRCTTLATDGETFGHHHRNGDAVLAEALARVRAQGDVTLTNAAAMVARHPAALEAELVAPSSWSCAHGVERWRSDCGCRLDAGARTSQRWRTPLRETLEQLAARCHAQFEQEGRDLFAGDPWHVRDAYGEVVSRDGAPIAAFVAAHVRDASQQQRARELLELERAVMRTFTSCAWFFDDVARIETRQVLRYAARALELSGHAARWTPDVVAGLSRAESNAPGGGTAADLFVREALPHRDPALRAAAGVLAMSAGQPPDAAAPSAPPRIGAYDAGYDAADDATDHATSEHATDEHAGPAPPAPLRITHRRTGRRVHVAGTVDGIGPTLVVSVRNVDRHDDAVQEFPVRELPETAAREVLARTVDTDLALA